MLNIIVYVLCQRSFNTQPLAQGINDFTPLNYKRRLGFDSRRPWHMHPYECPWITRRTSKGREMTETIKRKQFCINDPKGTTESSASSFSPAERRSRTSWPDFLTRGIHLNWNYGTRRPGNVCHPGATPELDWWSYSGLFWLVPQTDAGVSRRQQWSLEFHPPAEQIPSLHDAPLPDSTDWRSLPVGC